MWSVPESPRSPVGSSSSSSWLNSLAVLRFRRLFCCWFCPRERLILLPPPSFPQSHSDHLTCRDVLFLIPPVVSSIFSYVFFFYYLLVVPLMHLNSHQHIYGYIEVALVLLSIMAALTSTSVSRAFYQLERSSVHCLVGAQLPSKSMCLQKWTSTFTSVVGLLLLLCYSTVQPIELMCNGVLLFGCAEHLVWSGLTFGWSLVWIYIILRASRLEGLPRQRVVVDTYGRAIIQPATNIYSSSPQTFTAADIGGLPPPIAIGLPLAEKDLRREREEEATTAECSDGEDVRRT
eukprot:GHVS01040117.1.p1 GENE.GHVS01040117.1~~GHVS01040117.1.p1  ORF type:complete len:290 (-),score=41.59 GHVS01040117.1:346-1215(-)